MKKLKLFLLMIANIYSFASDFDIRSLSYYERIKSPGEEIISLGGRKYKRSELDKFAGNDHNIYNCHDHQKPSILNNTNLENVVNVSLAISSAYLVFFSEKDKLLHGIVGAVVGGGVTYLCEKIFFKGNNSLTCAIAGSVAGTALAVAKEYRDSRGFGNVEFADALATGGVAVLASFKMSFNGEGELDIRPSFKPL